MPPWLTSTIDVVQLVVNVGALVGGAIIWKLYVDNLKAALTVKDTEISSVEKNRDMWRDKANELEKRSPEFMERMLNERLQIWQDEFSRLAEDKGRHEEALELMQREKANLETDLSRTRGFRLMLALEEENSESDDDLDETSHDLPLLPPVNEVQVVLLGEVGVDSGQLMLTDPCYIDAQWQHDDTFDIIDNDDAAGKQPPKQSENLPVDSQDKALPPYSYAGTMEATSSGSYGELAFKLGHAGAGVVFLTAWGDGIYPVYGELHDGRIVRAYINVG